MSVCARCHAGCCRSLMLLITAWDALRLARDLERPPESFTQFVPLGEGQARALGAGTGLIRFADTRGPLEQHVLTLRKDPSALMPGTHKCTFLLEWPQEQPDPDAPHPGARVAGRCGVYGSRPLMCRTYPAMLDPQRGPVVAQRASMREAEGDQALCPEPWSAEMYGERAGETVQELVLERYEFEFFAAAVARWNREPGPRAEFFGFMERAYAGRLRTVEEDYAEQESRVPGLSLADVFPQYRAFTRTDS